MDDDLTSRLGELGRQPVPPATSAAHLTAMSALGPDATCGPRRFGRDAQAARAAACATVDPASEPEPESQVEPGAGGTEGGPGS